jgi:hypothetical protein
MGGGHMKKIIITLLLVSTFFIVAVAIIAAQQSEDEILATKCGAECQSLKGADCGSVPAASREYVSARAAYHRVGDDRGYYHPTGSYWYQELLNLSLAVEKKKQVLKSLCPKTMLKEKD